MCFVWLRLIVGVVGSSVFWVYVLFGDADCYCVLGGVWLILVVFDCFGLFTVVWVIEVVFLHAGLFVAAGGLRCLGLCCLMLHV